MDTQVSQKEAAVPHGDSQTTASGAPQRPLSLDYLLDAGVRHHCELHGPPTARVAGADAAKRYRLDANGVQLLVNAFTIAYGAGTLICGRIIDKLGTKISYAVAMVVWSAATMLHAAVGTVVGFAIVRVILGLGESVNFPAAMKVIADWHPKKERTLATGILGVAVNLGVVVSPALIPFIAIHYGWHGAFLILGAVGFVWLIPWFFLFGKPQDKASAEELA